MQQRFVSAIAANDPMRTSLPELTFRSAPLFLKLIGPLEVVRRLFQVGRSDALPRRFSDQLFQHGAQRRTFKSYRSNQFVESILVGDGYGGDRIQSKQDFF